MFSLFAPALCISFQPWRGSRDYHSFLINFYPLAAFSFSPVFQSSTRRVGTVWCHLAAFHVPLDFNLLRMYCNRREVMSSRLDPHCLTNSFWFPRFRSCSAYLIPYLWDIRFFGRIYVAMFTWLRLFGRFSVILNWKRAHTLTADSNKADITFRLTMPNDNASSCQPLCYSPVI